MNRLFKFGAIIVLLIVFSSCITQKKCLEKFPPKETRDSVYIVTLKEVPVYLPGDTISVNTPANCPDQDLFKMENAKLKQEIAIVKGRLISVTTVKPDTVIKYVPEVHEKIVTKEIPQPVKYIPKIYKDALWIRIILFAGAFTWFGFKIFKFFRP